ncbi:MAG: rod shape-determining protein MreC [Minisyncoccia bacterium]|jgi:cell shape-determining protein MreC
MTYLRPHKLPLSRRKRAALGSAVFLIFLVILVQWSLPSVFPGLFTSLAVPFWRERFSIESGALRSPAELLAENAALQTELAALKLYVASSSVAMLQTENAELKALLGRASTTPSPYVLAAVLARPQWVPYDGLTIDLGRSDGVSTTSLVYAPGNVLIGRVVSVLSRTSEVALLSSPGETYNVFIGADRLPATAVGRGDGQYRAELSHGSSVAAGDFVSDPSLYDGPFGVVVSVVSGPSNPFDEILIAPPVNVSGLRWVLLQLNSPDKNLKPKSK